MLPLHMCLSVPAWLLLQLLILWFFFTELQAHINIREYPDIPAFSDFYTNERIIPFIDVLTKSGEGCS